RVLPLGDARALLALLGVLERVEVRGRRDGYALDTDGDARAVHHPEHLRHALVLDRADQLADAAVVLAEVEHAGRRAVDAHLVLDAADGDVVRLAERAVRVRADLRHDEEREALGA